MRLTLTISVFTVLLQSCNLVGVQTQEAQFSSNPTISAIQPGQIDEASGVVDSRSMPGNLWVEEDSGNPNDLVLLGHDGKIKGRVPVPNAQNRDWEDMAMGPGPQSGVNYIYLGDIGDNNAQYPTCTIYRLPEPKSLTDAVTQVDRITFRYPDGPRDAEALLLDPKTSDLWIVTKREENVHLYRLPYPQSTTDVITAQAYGAIPLVSGITGGDISPDGSEILLRTYLGVLYWKRQGNELLADVLQKRSYRTLPYRIEPQGEAVCFDRLGSGYFTLSERNNAAAVSLYYYPRK
ncbi:WD40 repeat domain-containing protein [Nibrella viscosa]|uniref:WD40 repeat domain-containing protein n=1 Tax=Nibrella viscosa TaxID=1084524 RepID=A0ABP8KIY9_9BACT